MDLNSSKVISGEIVYVTACLVQRRHSCVLLVPELFMMTLPTMLRLRVCIYSYVCLCCDCDENKNSQTVIDCVCQPAMLCLWFLCDTLCVFWGTDAGSWLTGR